MEIVTTSSALHLFPKDQRYKTKGVRYNNLIDFLNISLLPVNPKIELDDPHILSLTRRDGREKYDVVAASKKRQNSGEEKPLKKRQKKITEEVESTTKAKSIRKLTPSLHKTLSESKQETKRKVTKSVDVKASTTTKVIKPEKSITACSKDCLHETETKKHNGIDLRNLIAKAQDKIQNKRQIDHKRDDITKQRIAARLALNQDQRYKTKGVRYNNLIDFSNVSMLPVNPKIDLDDPQILSRTRSDGREKHDDVVVASKKRQHSGEEKPLKKRQKRITEEMESRTLTQSLHKSSVSESKQETKRKVSKPVDARAITTTKVTKPEKSIAASSKECLHESETKKPKGIDLRNLITKAQDKIQNKRQIDHQRDDITRQRLVARLALNQMVATVSCDDHLNYHRELEQLGHTFIQEQVDHLSMFNLWSRSDYNGITNSVLENNKTPWPDEDSTRKKHRQSSTKGNSMEQHSFQIQSMVILLRAEIRVIAQQV